MSVYLSNPNAPPDSDFEPGELHHLVVGNAARSLDPRRTPFAVVDVRPQVGTFVLRIEDFEDKGAHWEVPFEDVSNYQFALGSRRASDAVVADFRQAITRFDQALSIACDPKAATASAAKVEEERAAALQWLENKSRFFAEKRKLPDPSTREGDALLYRDLRAFMEARGVWAVEEAFARQYVSNPRSGDLVKGHRIVLAELGLVAYEGKVVRDPGLFEGIWSREQRARHVLARLAFVSALLRRAGYERVRLYRGVSTESPMEPADNRTFVSATFSRDVAMSHFDSGSALATRALYHQAVPVERLFMTYYETAQMNEPFKEAEAVLLFEPENCLF
ncbi:MAG: hypothetical protein ACYSXF_07620 [Planctomycetota bacterium]|jgi:hypothetical protein